MKSLRRTARRRMIRPALLAAPVFIAAAVAIALALAALLPAAQAWEYHSPNYRVASMTCPDATVYPGTNTWFSRCLRLDEDGVPVERSQSSWLHEDGLRWEAADAAARAIVNDQDGYGHQYGWLLWIPIRSDAAPGDYTFNIQTRGRNYEKEPDATATLTLTVIGRPDTLSARLSRSEYDPGDRIIIRGTVRAANGALATFTRDPVRGHGVPQRCQDCFWRAADAATAAALEIPEGYLSDGTFRARVAANALPGEYSIVVSHPATGSQYLSFTVTGTIDPVTPDPEPTPDPGAVRPPALPPGPASYTLAGHDAIAAGRTAIYTVTGTANDDGSLPNLEGANARVNVLVDGPGRDAVTISAADGAVTLNDGGVGSVALRVAAGTAPTSVTLEIVGAIDADPVIRRLSIGTEMPDLGDAGSLTLQPGAGAAAGSVTLRWTPGANADRHWIAGIKVSDWDAGDYSSIIWTRADSNTMHTVTGLDAGAEYAFTVIAGRLVNGQTEWGSWAAIQRVTVPAAQ